MESSSDLVEFFKLETRFLHDCTEHTQAVPDPTRIRRKSIKEVKQWRRVRELGEGGFGVVWLEEEQGGELRAVKEIRKRDQQSNRIDIIRELLAMAYFSRDASTFIKFQGWFETDAGVFLAMEYLKLGDLHRCVLEPLPEDEASLIIFQVAEGLKTMHSNGFTHRDLKPTNIFVVSKSPRWWIKIGDFGISKRVRDGLQTRMVGDYVAPEILNLLDEDEETSQDYTSAIDMWSLGCVAQWLLTRTTPFPNGRGLRRYCSGKASFPTDELSSRVASAEATDFVTSIMAIMPSKRLTAEEALQHPWLASSVDDSTSEDESIRAAKGPSDEQPEDPEEISSLDFDNAKPLVDDQESVQNQKPFEGLTKTDDSSAATNGFPPDPRAEGLDSQKITGLKVPLLKPLAMGDPQVPAGNVPATSQVPPRIAEPEWEEVKKFMQVNASGQTNLVANKTKEAENAKSRPQISKAIVAKSQDAKDKSPDVEAVYRESFRRFAAKESVEAKAKRLHSLQDTKEQKAGKLNDLKKFSQAFKLPTPVPKDLLPILSKDSSRQSEIAEQAQRDAAQGLSLSYKYGFEDPGPTLRRKPAPTTQTPSPASTHDSQRPRQPQAPRYTLRLGSLSQGPQDSPPEGGGEPVRTPWASQVVVKLPPENRSAPARLTPPAAALREPSATSVPSDIDSAVSEQTDAGKVLSRKQWRKRARQAAAQTNIPGNDPVTP